MAKYNICKNVVTSEVDEELIVLFGGSKKMLVLNETSAEIFKLIDQGLDLMNIIESLSNKYDAPREDIAKGVIKTITSFEEKGIINLNEND